MTAIRTDIPDIQPSEHWDAYAQRLYNTLGEGEIAHGFRRRADALEHVGNDLEYLADMDATEPYTEPTP